MPPPRTPLNAAARAHPTWQVDALKAEVDDLKRSVSHLTAENWHLKSLLASNATAIEDNANEIAKLENLHADVLHGPVCMTGAMGWQDIFYLRQFEFGLYWASGNNYGGSALLFIHNNWDGNSNYAANLQVISQGGDGECGRLCQLWTLG